MRLNQVTCPKCQTTLTSRTGIEEGTSVNCLKCKLPFMARVTASEIDAEAVDDFDLVDEAESPRSPRPNSSSAEKTDSKRGSSNRHAPIPRKERDNRTPKRNRRDDDDDDRPKAKRRRDLDDDHDDDEDRPRKRKRRDRDDGGVYDQLKGNVWVRGTVLGVLLTIMGVLGYMLYRKHQKGDEVIVLREEDEAVVRPAVMPTNMRRNGVLPQTTTTPKATVGDSAKMQGLWLAKQVQIDGEAYTIRGLQDLRFRVQGDMWTHVSDNARVQSRTKLDALKQPNQIDFMNLTGRTNLGIYRFIDDDTVEICSKLDPGAERPQEFTAPGGSRCVHMILKRGNSKEEPKQTADDLSHINGTWDVQSFRVHLQTAINDLPPGVITFLMLAANRPNAFSNLTLTISDDQWVLDSNGDSEQYSFTAATSPAQIDFIRADGSTLPAIYRFAYVDTMEVAIALRGDRPNQFPPHQGDYAILMLKRKR